MNVEVRVYDRELTPLGVIDEITSLIWTPTYWNEGTTGDTKLLAPMTENNKKLLAKGNIIVLHDGDADYTDDRGTWRRAAQIKYRHITKDVNGAEQVEVQGYFLKKWLSKRIILKKIVMNGTEQQKINRIVRENAGEEAAERRKFQQFVILNQEDLGGSSTDYANEDYVDAGKEIYNRALAGKLGYDILVNEESQLFGFLLYKGKDLTSSNTEGNTPSTFSRDFDNVNGQEYKESDENKKNVMYVTGAADENSNIPLVEVDQGGEGLERSEVYVDMSNISRTYEENEVEVTIAPEEYLKMLKAAGETGLEDYGETVAFEAKINVASNLVYGRDFSLGDRVTCIEKSWNICIDVRITAVSLTYQNGIKEIEATLGESLPTLLQQIRKVR